MIREAAYRALTIFKFQTPADTKQAEELLKQKIDLGMDISYTRVKGVNEISVGRDKEADIDEILTKGKITFKVDEGVGRQAQTKSKPTDGAGGEYFHFRVRVNGPSLPSLIECHPDCEYRQGRTCNLFKTNLEVEDDRGYLRTKNCMSAVEGLV